MADIIRALVPSQKSQAFIEAHMTAEIAAEHRNKFSQDVMVELKHLDASRFGGLGITREELQLWLDLNHINASG